MENNPDSSINSSRGMGFKNSGEQLPLSMCDSICNGLARNSTCTRLLQFPALLSASIISAAFSKVNGLWRPFDCNLFKIEFNFRVEHFCFRFLFKRTCWTGLVSYSIWCATGDPSARNSSRHARATSSWTSSDWWIWFSLAFCYFINQSLHQVKYRPTPIIINLLLNLQRWSWQKAAGPRSINGPFPFEL